MGRTSTTAGLRQPSLSVSRSVRATSVPLTETEYTLSAVMASVAEVMPAGRPTVWRNHRVPAGASAAGSPSGNQIQRHPWKDGAPVSSFGGEIHRAVHCSAPSSPVSHQEGSLQPDTEPLSSHTRTDQKYRVLGLSSGPR